MVEHAGSPSLGGIVALGEISDKVDGWLAEGQAVVLATVVKTWGSAPRQVGAKMAFTGSGEMVGSVSGGCVEGVVLEEGARVLETRAPRLLSFGVTNDQAWEVGLSCGGEIEIFVEVLST